MKLTDFMESCAKLKWEHELISESMCIAFVEKNGSVIWMNGKIIPVFAKGNTFVKDYRKNLYIYRLSCVANGLTLTEKEVQP
jgi:hypothetical protein